MSTGSRTVASRLPDIVGPGHAINDPAQLAFYEIDGVMPGAAVRPGSREEIVEVVKFAAAENLAVIASGARTKLGIGLAPRRYDIALDMTRMDRVIAYDPADLTLSVEAGHSLQKLLGILGDHRQFLPLFVPYFNRTTIGGTIASGVDSPLRQFYGTARDYVLGMEYVTGEGVLAKTGGRVVKNVTGYDLHKLMIGALGTLGVMVSVNFKT
jgi:glycolate oxidase FAD binding subunit